MGRKAWVGRKEIVLVILLLKAIPLWAEEPKIPEGYEFVIKKSEVDKEPLSKLSPEDERIAKAIEKASAYAQLQNEHQKISFPMEYIRLIIEYCRKTWNRKGKFIDYIKSEIDRNKTNCDGWFKYYEVFYEKCD